MIAGWSRDLMRQFENTAAGDGDLLGRFVRERDQQAFAEIVRRHGAVVLGVSRRITRQEQDAEDAFQAVFLTLARKAHRIRNADLLGNWLYGVAVRIAARAERAARRRGRREVLVRRLPEQASLPTTPVSDLPPIIDEELAALPQWYREAIVLCDLRGVSRAEAAAALHIPEGTLSSRLASGRKKLAARLAKRGIALSAALVPASISTAQGSIIVPTELLKKTCGRVLDMLAGKSLPRPLLILIEGEMTMRKSVILILSSVVLAAGVAYAMQSSELPPVSETPKQSIAQAKKENLDQPTREPKPEDKAVEYTNQPRLKGVQDINISSRILQVFWNSEGTELAIVSYMEDSTGLKLDPNQPIAFLSLDQKQLKSLNPRNQSQRKSEWVGFTADGKTPVTFRDESTLISGYNTLYFWKTDPAFPSTSYIVDRTLDLNLSGIQQVVFSPNEMTFKALVVGVADPKTKSNSVSIVEMNATTGKPLKSLLKVSGTHFTLSQDGSKLAVIDLEEVVSFYDVNSGKMNWSLKLPDELKKPINKGVNRQPVSRNYSLALSTTGNRLVICGAFPPRSRLPITPKSGGKLATPDHSRDLLVIDTDKGKPLPPLENAEFLRTGPEPFAFSGDGRLLVLTGERYRIIKSDKDADGSDKGYADSLKGFLTVWDTETGKVVKSWDRQARQAAFNPAKPILAIFENNGNSTRIGFWDFAAEPAAKK